MKHRASRCSVVATQNRHQKLNGTVTGLTHDRRVDCEPCCCGSRVTPVRFEIPARAASRSSKLIFNQGETPAQSNRGAHCGECSVRRSGFSVSPRAELNAQTTALR